MPQKIHFEPTNGTSGKGDVSLNSSEIYDAIFSELSRTEAHAILRSKDYETGTFIIRKGSHAMGRTNKGKILAATGWCIEFVTCPFLPIELTCSTLMDHLL